MEGWERMVSVFMMIRALKLFDHLHAKDELFLGVDKAINNACHKDNGWVSLIIMHQRILGPLDLLKPFVSVHGVDRIICIIC